VGISRLEGRALRPQRPPAAHVAHVIFDLDGTLVDSRADLAGAVNYTRETLGLSPLDPHTVSRYVGDGARALIERALGPARRELWNHGLQTFLGYYRQHLLDRTGFYPGMLELLADLAAARISASVLTNKPEDLSRRILAGLGALDAFGGLVGGDTLPVRKPDPGGVACLVERAGVARERTLMVGDSLVDVATARAAGVAFCGVGWGFDPERLAAEPVALAASAAALQQVLLGGW
jgi:phosphoglycolate phosphatase